MHAHKHVHKYVWRSLDTAPAPHKLHEIFSEFFNMCSFPFRTCRCAKKNVGGEGWGDRKEGEMESMRAKAEQAAGENEQESHKPTGRQRERGRRERENPADSVPSYSP